jgi:hypothetical protein
MEDNMAKGTIGRLRDESDKLPLYNSTALSEGHAYRKVDKGRYYRKLWENATRPPEVTKSPSKTD